MNIFVTSDLHFGHDKSFLYEPRGFSSPEEHALHIVENWNSVVGEDDIVYNLGDMALTSMDMAIPYLQQLHGRQIWLLGNHDTTSKVNRILSSCRNIMLLGPIETAYVTMLKHGKWLFYLSHYPTMISNYDDDEKKNANRFWCLCGHTHQKTAIDAQNRCYHCELDVHNNFPVNIETIIEDLRKFNALAAGER